MKSLKSRKSINSSSNSTKVIMLSFYILLALTQNYILINAKSLDQFHLSNTDGNNNNNNNDNTGSDEIQNHNHHDDILLPKDNSKKSHAISECDKNFFDAINVNSEQDNNRKGDVCGGHCCSNSTENDLRQKATSNFEKLLRHHTKSLRGILESTTTSFRDHVLELSRQSENKTLNVFSQVYRRMFPSSKHLINELYTNIRNHLTSSVDYQLDYQLDEAVQIFFKNLFPIAYHQAVHLNNDGNNGDLHDDYVNCLKHTFVELSPFGDIPKQLSKNLVQSVQAATVFINALEQATEVLANTDNLDSNYLTSTCKNQLLKMSYCPSCNGYHKQNTKTCYSYCLNVMRGCLAQCVGVLDNPWSNVAEAIERLVTNCINTNVGIINTIKGLDAKLSEAIMRAMENGPELEKKVKKTCGSPKLLPVHHETNNDNRTGQLLTTIKWATPPDAELLLFLSTIEKSKDFYLKIVNTLCGDEEYQRNDRRCWMGDRIGDYTQTVMATGSGAQKYNPEVPLAQHSNAQVMKLNELVDKLIKLRLTIVTALPSNTVKYSDIQGDMARHDDLEGSGRFGRIDDLDDEEFNNVHGSGDGSGDGPTSTPDYSDISPRTISELDTNSILGSKTAGTSTIRTNSLFNILNSLVFLIVAAFLLH